MSTALSEQISQVIKAAGGWIPFDEFMRRALYAPGLGYYETGEVFGADGDFVTAPDVGPWLALGLADLVEWGWKQLGEPDDWALVEQGGGEGRLLCSVLGMLGDRDMVMPKRIHAVERSGHMRARQQQAYAAQGLEVTQHAELAAIGEESCAVFISNELPDAFPVRCFVKRGCRMLERGVGLDATGDFVWQDGPELAASDEPEIDAGIMNAWPEDYVGEWNPGLDAWQAGVAGLMQRGVVITVDYGFSQSEYYRPQRIEGTLLAHLNHQPEHDVLSDPGSRDITAHIDFTALQRIGRRHRLDMGCWMAQGAWLAQSPAVQAVLREAAMQPTAENVKLISGAKRMLLPQGMGELFKLAVQSKGMPAAAPGFLASFNRVQALESGHARV